MATATTPPPAERLFVYGSLKEGFPNFHVNRGTRVGGHWRTAEPHPLHLHRNRLPCLLPLPGQGLHVRGQLFAVGPAELAAMDALERVGEPGGYARVPLEVVAEDGGERLTAWAYVQDPALLQDDGEHPGPLAEYTPEHALRLHW